jgi:hypothetical protein
MKLNIILSLTLTLLMVSCVDGVPDPIGEGESVDTGNGKDTSKDSNDGTDVIDTSGTDNDTGMDTGNDTGNDTGVDTGEDTGEDTGQDTGEDTGSGGVDTSNGTPVTFVANDNKESFSLGQTYIADMSACPSNILQCEGKSNEDAINLDGAAQAVGYYKSFTVGNPAVVEVTSAAEGALSCSCY